jgi:type VI secretion system secreted protein Hcp
MTPVPKRRACLPIRAIFAAAVLLLLPSTLRAQIDIFLQVGDIPGESRDTIRTNFGVAASWSWGGIHNTIDPTTRATKSKFHSLDITKPIDSATPKLMLACVRGRPLDRAVLILRKRGQSPVEFYRIILENVFVTSVQNSGPSGGNPSENLTLDYTRIGVEYFQITPKGAPGDRFEFAWDIANNRPSGVTFPAAVDADADGLPDVWENQYGLDPAKNDADLDPDGDGATNFEEYIAGTSPIDANQVLRAKLDLSPASGGTTLTLLTVPGKTYRILTSDNITGPFQPTQTLQATAGTTTLPATFDFPTQYFKIEVLP